MATILGQMSDTYTYLMEAGDPRSSKYPLVSTPTAMVLSTCAYLTFIHWGPRYFQTRKPLSIKPVIIVYNLVMVLLSVYMLKEFVVSAYELGYNIMCQPLESSYSPASFRMINVAWLFYVSKMVELCDTVFMVVRKKGQLTLLHVFHHSTVIFHQWIFVKYVPSSHAFFQATLNCSVHTIMYFYYFLSCFPNLQKYLWWKKYLTMIQMVQFVLNISHALSSIYSNCGFPLWVSGLILGECGILLVLFGNYFVQTHSRARRTEKKKP